MTEPAELSSPAAPAASPEPRRLLIEVALVFTASLILTRVLSDLANLAAFFAEYLFTLVAAVFLGLPWLVLSRRKASFEEHAMTWSRWPRGLAVALLCTALTAAPFAVGYHLWRTDVLEHTFHPSTDNYWHLPLELEGRPASLAAAGKPEVLMWRDGPELTVQWSTPPRAYTVQLDVEAPGGVITLPRGKQHARDPAIRAAGFAEGRLTLRSTTRSPTVRFVTLRVQDARAVSLRTTVDGRPAPATLLRLGPQRLSPADVGGFDAATSTLTLERTLGWLPLIILAQLLLVAFPEEFFYRGYLQTSLERRFPWRVQLGPLHLSAAMLITSALFALGHFVVDVRLSRLAVFFPSLLFGFLRDRTGTIVSCIVYHAACNLMVEALAPHYLAGG